MIFPSFAATLSGVFHFDLAKMKKGLFHFVLEKASIHILELIPLPKPETHVCH